MVLGMTLNWAPSMTKFYRFRHDSELGTVTEGGFIDLGMIGLETDYRLVHPLRTPLVSGWRKFYTNSFEALGTQPQIFAKTQGLRTRLSKTRGLRTRP